ncbi:MAG TPA: hypothetical protein VGQ20_14805 [Acidimicrobiales bacterium]|nr:hypothetical protein [Acidimicrobiales bacterium]
MPEIEVLRPYTVRTPEPGVGTIAAAPRSGEPLRLALVSNGKPNGAELLDLLATRLEAHVPIAEVRRYRKPSVSVPPDPADVAEIAEWANAALHAVGD